MVQADFNTEIDRFRGAIVDTINTEYGASFQNTQHIGRQHGVWVQWQHRTLHMLFHGSIPIQEVHARAVMLARDIVIFAMQQTTTLYQRAIVNFTSLTGVAEEFAVSLTCRWEGSTYRRAKDKHPIFVFRIRHQCLQSAEKARPAAAIRRWQ